MAGKEVAKKGETALTEYKEFMDDADLGNEELTQDYMTIPYLAILQSLSPQVDKRKEQYVEGAEAGMIINSVTGEVFDGEEGIRIVNCYFQPRFVEWVERDKGGGWVASYIPGKEPKTLPDKETGRASNQLENGNVLNMTHYHMCLLLKTDDHVAEEVVIGMSRTQLRHGLRWNTQFHMMKWSGEGGKKFTPPRFGTVWVLKTFLDGNEKGEWYNWRIGLDGPLDLSSDYEKAVYLQAREYAQLFKRGIEITPPSDGDDGSGGGPNPSTPASSKVADDEPF